MLKQMYEDYCANRLPCGICRLTNTQCPKIFGPITTVTCNSCGDAVPTTSATSAVSTTYNAKGRSTWTSVNTTEEPK